VNADLTDQDEGPGRPLEGFSRQRNESPEVRLQALEIVVVPRPEMFSVFGEGFAEFENGVGGEHGITERAVRLHIWKTRPVSAGMS
jgi:hypothetical protein